MNDMFERLAAPFPPDRVSWRVGSTTQDKKKGMALAYIDARDVMERFDAVCGPAGWERRHPHVTGTTTCEISIWVPALDRWIVKADGAGDTAVEAEKGSLSDSFKRAAVNWGVGRYLYDLPTPWVALDQYKKIEEGEHAKLRALLSKSGPRLVGNGKPTAAAMTAATALIAMDQCGNLDALTKWHAESKPHLDAMSDEDFAAVKAYWVQRRAVLSQKEAA